MFRTIGSLLTLWVWSIAAPAQQLGGTAQARTLGLDPQGNLWMLGTDFGVYQYQKDTWNEHPAKEKGRKLTVAPNGSLLAIGYDNKLYRSSDARQWETIPTRQLAKGAAADATGKLWMIGFDDRIYQQIGPKWVEYPGAGRAKELLVSAEGTPYHIGINDKVYVGTGKGWQELPCPKARRMALDTGNKLWIVGLDNRLYYPIGRSLRWVEYPEKLKLRDVAIGASGKPYYVAFWNNYIYQAKTAVR